MLVVATLYFLIVVALGVNLVAIPALTRVADLPTLALVGAALFGLFILVLLVQLVRGRQREEARQVQASAVAVPAPARRRGEDEYVVTSDEHQGLRVIEYSHPPKSQNKGAVYAKCLVPVSREFVLRVEELIAKET